MSGPSIRFLPQENDRSVFAKLDFRFRGEWLDVWAESRQAGGRGGELEMGAEKGQ